MDNRAHGTIQHFSRKQRQGIIVPVISPAEFLECAQVILKLAFDVVQRSVAGESLEPVRDVFKQLFVSVKHEPILLVDH